MTADIQQRKYPFTYSQEEYDKAKAELTIAVGDCTFANGHCVHRRTSYFSDSSTANSQIIGPVTWCCLCDKEHDGRTKVRR